MGVNDLSIDRRTAVAGIAAVAAGAAIAGCSRYSNSGTSGGKGTGSATQSGGAPLAKTTDIPVGGGKILDSVVITQPTAGTFKAFSTICPHQGCNVNTIQDGKIICPCHGSEFNVTDGSVAAGPSPAPLPERQVKVTGDSITLV